MYMYVTFTLRVCYEYCSEDVKSELVYDFFLLLSFWEFITLYCFNNMWSLLHVGHVKLCSASFAQNRIIHMYMYMRTYVYVPAHVHVHEDIVCTCTCCMCR